MDEKTGRVYCMTGDGELNEGQIWEAAMFAPKYNLNNLTWIIERNKIFKPNITVVDQTGVGSGTFFKIRDGSRHSVMGWKGAESPTSNKDIFSNVLAQFYWKLRGLFEQGLISIPNNSVLKQQLNDMQYSRSGMDKIVIEKPGGKSPDWADSLCLACRPSVDSVSFLGGISIR
jgi:hypothetical protein